jgi:DNA-binding response OmpR family regulator
MLSPEQWMQALVVAERPERREALARELRRAGHEVTGLSDAAGVTEETRRSEGSPDIFVVDVGDDAATLRNLIERAREAAEDPDRPVLVLLPEHSSWLRGVLPPELQPVIAVGATARPAEAVAHALQAWTGRAGGRDGEHGGLTFDELRRKVAGPGGSAQLTPSEASILSALLREGRSVATHDRIALALWGNAFADRFRRASIRSHVHTLRRKLSAIGLADAIVSVPGVGYRLLDDGLRR